MNTDTIFIDGSAGEGGGQVLRTSLSLSLVTGKPFRIEKIRANRDKPGLLRQHLTAVKAAADIGRARVEGDYPGSQVLEFQPGEAKCGEFSFAVGTAGSATLVLQTVLAALALGTDPSRLTLEGGTHNPWAPPVDFLQKCFLPVFNRMGPSVGITIERYGFFPAGGGRFTVDVKPARQLSRIDIPERGEILSRKARALVANLPENVGRREIETVVRRWEMERSDCTVETVDSPGPGNALMLEIISEHATELVTGFGRRGTPAEEVAREAVEEARLYTASGAPVGAHLADQLLIPMALSGGGSFRTCEPTGHTATNAGVIGKFLDVEIGIARESDLVWKVEIS